MPRPPRIDYPGAIHHAFVRAVSGSRIALDESDYDHMLHLLETAVSRFGIACHAYCVLPNHAHYLITSCSGNLSRAMHWLGTCTAQAFNRRYERYGHVYQGRFGSRLVENDDYFLELARYVALNPVKAGLCDRPEGWQWSSYAATAGLIGGPTFLYANDLLEQLGGIALYTEWVAAGHDSIALDDAGIPRRTQRPSLSEIVPVDSDLAVAQAHFRHGYSQVAIARHLGVSPSQISRRLAAHS
jgi:REP element-mobilizing transposase RayT